MLVVRLSSRVLCATLAIPIPASRSRIDALMKMDESTLEKKKRLSNLLSLKEPPTRVALVKDLVRVMYVTWRLCVSRLSRTW